MTVYMINVKPEGLLMLEECGAVFDTEYNMFPNCKRFHVSNIGWGSSGNFYIMFFNGNTLVFPCEYCDSASFFESV